MSGTILGSAILELRTDDSKLNSGIDAAKGKVEGLGSTFSTVAKVGVAAMAGIGIAAGAGAAVSVKEFMAFEKGMNEVFTLLPGITQSAMGDMTGQVKDFSKEFGTLPGEVVPALYSALSAGVPPGNVFDFLGVANKAAVGGVTDLNTAVDGITSTVNAYGAETLTAGDASDKMFEAVRLGKTTFGELSSSLFQVNPIASSLGVNFGDVTAALAAMTVQGVPTAVATTQLRQAFVELSKEGGATSDTFKEVAGVGFKEFIASGGNVQGALQLMEQRAKDTGVGVNDLFGSVEAGAAALALTGGGTEAFTTAMDAMGNSAGATDRAFETMEGGLSRNVDKIKANFAVLKLEVGSRLAPAFAQFTDFVLATALPALLSLGSTIQTTVAPALQFLGEMAGRLKDAFSEGGLMGVISALPGVFASIGGAILDTLGGIDWAGIAGTMIGGLTGALSSAASGAISLGSTVVGWFSGIDWSSVGTTIVDGIMSGISAVADAGSRMLSWLSGQLTSVDWSGLGATVVTGLLTGVTAVADAGSRVLAWLSGQLSAVDWSGMGTTIVDGFMTGVTTVADAGQRVYQWINGQVAALDWTSTGQSIGASISGGLATLDLGPLQGFFDTLAVHKETIAGVGLVLGVVVGIFVGLSALVAPVAAIIATVTGAFAALGTAVGGGGLALGGLVAILGGPVTIAIAAIALLVGGFALAWTQDWFNIQAITTSAITAISGILTSLWTAISAGVSAILPSLTAAWGTLTAQFATGTPLMTQIQALFTALGPVISILTPIFQALGVVIGTTLVVAIGLAIGVLGGLVGFIAGALPGAITVATGLIQAFTGVIQVIGSIVTGMIAIVSAALQGDWSAAWQAAQTMVSGVVTGITNIVVGLGTAVIGAIQSMVGGVGGMISGFVDAIIGFFTSLYQSVVGGSIVPDMISGIIEWFGKLPGEVIGIISGFVTSAIGFFIDLATEGASKAGELIDNVMTALGRLASEAVTHVSNFVTSAVGFLGDLVSDGATKAADFVTGVMNALIDLFVQGPGRIFDFVVAGVAEIAKLATDGATKAAELPGAVLTAIGDLSGYLVQAGKDLVQGLINGMSNLLSAVGEKASEIAGAAKNAITGALGLNSPSKVMYEYGKYVDQGLINGMASGEGDVEAASGAVGLAAVRGAENNVDLTTIGKRQMNSWARGIEAGAGDVSGAAGDVAGGVNSAVVETLGGGRQFQADTFLSELSAFSEFILSTVIASATSFEEELITAAKSYTDAVKSSTDLFTSALALLELLGNSNPNAATATAAIEELNLFTRGIIESVSASAALVGGGGEDGLLAQTQEYVAGTQAGVDLLKSGAELFATLSTLTGDLDTAKQAASDIKFLTESIILSVGDSAGMVSATRPDGFTAQASAYATDAKSGVDLMSAGADVFTKLSDVTGNLDRAKLAASDIKFLTEFIVLSIGDSAAYIAAERGDGFVAQAGIYAEAALTAVSLISAAATTMSELELVQIDLDRAKAAASQMKFLTEFIVQSIGDSAAMFTTEGLASIQAYSDAALAGFEIMKGVAPTLESMLAFGALDASGVDLNARALEMADLTRMIVAALQDSALMFQADGLGAVTAFSTAATSALDLMGGVGAALESILLFGQIDTTGRDLNAISQNMVTLIETIVRQIEIVAVYFEAAGLDAVTQFSDAALKGLEVMGAAGDALSAILMFGSLSPEERDGLKQLAFEMTGVMDYIISMIRDMSTAYTTEGIDQLSAFATAAKQSLELVTTAESAFKAMVDQSRVTQEHADAFLSSWTIVVELVKDVADIVSTQGVQDALRFLQAAEEIAALMTAANNAIGSVAPQPLPDTSASGAKPADIANVTSPTAGVTTSTAKTGSGNGAFEKVYGVSKAEYFGGAASGGVTTRATTLNISEGNKREGIIPLENGGAGIVAKELVDQMRKSPEWASMATNSLPSGAAMNPLASRQAVSDIDINFNAPVTINARDRADAERSLGDIGWGIRAAQRKRGAPR